MVNQKKILTIETTVVILLWVFVLSLPLVFMDDFDQNWTTVYVMWIESLVVGVAFLINRFWLMPRLFFTKKYTKYIISIVALLLILGVFLVFFDGVNLILSWFKDIPADPVIPAMREGTPPLDMPPMRGGAPPPGMSSHALPPTAIPHKVIVMPPSISVLIFTVIVIALDMGISIAVKWILSEQKQAEINKERVVAQLSNLQSQVSPHFFMNTLNNIHALVDIDAKRAKQTLIELSNLMDYLLYESSTKENVSLQRELDFIGNYINLMRIRYSEQVNIEFWYEDSVPSVRIPPLLFLNFIENAFKYGVDYDRESFVKINFKFSESTVEMIVQNTNHSSRVHAKKGHGLGIINSCKRLDLLYGDRCSLDMGEKDNIYIVNLKIPIL